MDSTQNARPAEGRLILGGLGCQKAEMVKQTKAKTSRMSVMMNYLLSVGCCFWGAWGIVRRDGKEDFYNSGTGVTGWH